APIPDLTEKPFTQGLLARDQATSNDPVTSWINLGVSQRFADARSFDQALSWSLGRQAALLALAAQRRLTENWYHRPRDAITVQTAGTHAFALIVMVEM